MAWRQRWCPRTTPPLEIIGGHHRSMDARGVSTLRSEDIRYGESVTGRRLKVGRR